MDTLLRNFKITTLTIMISTATITMADSGSNYNPDPTPAGYECIKVPSNGGWVRLSTRGSAGSNRMELSIGGSWTVDSANYGAVNPADGHNSAALEQYAQYKYDQRFAFGKLLWFSEDDNAIYGPTNGVFMMHSGMQFRINDSDATLADNAGEAKVCAKYFWSAN